MKQISLSFNEQTPLKKFIESIVLTELDSNVLDYNNDKHVNTLLKKMASICDVLSGFYQEKHTKNLIDLVTLFESELSQETIGNFYYNQLIKSEVVMVHDTQFLVLNKYKEFLPEQEWKDKILSSYGLRAISTVRSNLGNTFYNDYSYLGLSQEKKELVQEFYRGDFIHYVVDKIKGDESADYLLPILTLLVNNHNDVSSSKIGQLVDKETLSTILKKVAICINYDVYSSLVLESKKFLLSSSNGNVNELKKFYNLLFQSNLFNTQERNELLFNDLKIDKKFFYSNTNIICDTINHGKFERVQEMFSLLQFPVDFDLTQQSLVLQLANCRHITNGIPIRIASYFLSICETDFEKGKFLLDNLFAHVKDYFKNDMKNEDESLGALDYLMLYCKKKQKSSVIIATQYKNLQNVIINYEKQKLNNLLQIPLPFKESFKL